MTPRKTDETPGQALLASDVTTELAAMQRVAMALGDLRDEQARLRVIRWAMERYFPAAAVETASGPAAVSASGISASDATLEVDSLTDFFVRNTVVDSDDDDCTDQPAKPAVREPIESMVKGFVADFQQLAAAWQGV
jgi:hypothetical protein